jgi:hypothetical protein
MLRTRTIVLFHFPGRDSCTLPECGVQRVHVLGKVYYRSKRRLSRILLVKRLLSDARRCQPGIIGTWWAGFMAGSRMSQGEPVTMAYAQF